MKLLKYVCSRMIRKEKEKELKEKMNDLGIHEKDLVEKFILGSGKGGQKASKSSSCVYLRHIPTGIEIKCQKDRLREVNRFLARRELVERYQERFSTEETKKQKLQRKIREQKKRRRRRRDANLQGNQDGEQLT